MTGNHLVGCEVCIRFALETSPPPGPVECTLADQQSLSLSQVAVREKFSTHTEYTCRRASEACQWPFMVGIAR